MTDILFMVPGVPVAKARPRVTKTGITFTPKKTELFENLVRMAFCQKYPGREPVEETLQLTMTFTFPIPESAKRKKLPDKIKEGDYYFHRPDIDNLIKGVQDALNGVAYKDDAQVVMMIARKVYGTIPGTYVSLNTIAPQPIVDPGIFEEGSE